MMRTKRMVCNCPYLASRTFLVCKHLVQAFQPVPSKFFLKVKRRRTAPFWKHPNLKPLEGESSSGGGNVGPVEREGGEGPTNKDLVSDDEEDEDNEGVIDKTRVRLLTKRLMHGYVPCGDSQTALNTSDSFEMGGCYKQSSARVPPSRE